MIIIYLVSFYIFVSKKTFIQGIEPFSSYLFHFSNNYVYFKKLAESAIFKSGVQYLIKPFFPKDGKKKLSNWQLLSKQRSTPYKKKRFCIPAIVSLYKKKRDIHLLTQPGRNKYSHQTSETTPTPTHMNQVLSQYEKKVSTIIYYMSS